MGEKVAAAVTGITISVLLMQVCLYFGLKYLWNIMNLIQFLIFMQMWLMRMPAHSRIFMRELKALALLEFIPYAWLSEEEPETVSSYYVSEEIGIDRFGTNNLVQGLGSMLVIGMALVIVILIALAMRLLATYSSRIMTIYLSIKTKMQYNSLLRFVL